MAGIDIGGTFTDVVVADKAGRIVTAKAPSTPPDFSTGIIDALGNAAETFGITLDDLCRNLDFLAHGTTVGTNALIQKRGAKVGILTTKGHEDCIHIMRGSRGLTGQNIRKVSHFSEGLKPQPLVPKRMIRGISERVDSNGNIVVPLDEAGARKAIAELVEAGAEAIAICFLWCFKNPSHETRVRDLIHEIAPDIFVSSSYDLVPKWGEYERTTAAALNAYIGPITSTYLRNVSGRLKDLGYQGNLQITQCGGGTISLERAMMSPLLTLDSGPVAGVTGSEFLGATMGLKNIITTDMGGTSFDVGLISDGVGASSYKSIVEQYEYFLPKIDIQAIGAGGGSLAWVDERTNSLHVGPDSAGSVPGPICYGRGGTVPTVTDAALVLGYLDPNSFAGGKMKLDREEAARRIGELGRPLGLGVDECAAGICRIVEFRMADAIRRTTVEKGHDPRDFTVFAFGGAGPAHAGIFAREAGISRVIIPQRKTASVWCAFGAAAADVLHVIESANLMASPFNAGAIAAELKALADRARAQMATDDITDFGLTFSIDLRHRGQINEVEVNVPGEGLSEAELATLIEDFFVRYEALYGKGSSFRKSRLEAVTFRCRARSETVKPSITAVDCPADADPDAFLKGRRSVYWSDEARRFEVPVYDGDAMTPGCVVAGPAIIETSHTSVTLHSGQTLLLDQWGNFSIDITADQGGSK
ncbi:hydantoinase/oxoprolinase family protein [Antarctobacter sp.]|uniref:hydantoinase/oxoprolinase family protein n=1 Tax=Antarctobacter sp. TaxID=1872577 RepID=UPI003A93C94C